INCGLVMFRIFMVITFLCVGKSAGANTLPEVGERVYMATGDDPYAPVKIVPATEHAGLKDPTLEFDKKKATPIVVAKPKPVPKAKRQTLSFKPIRVAGRPARPRVEF